MIRRKASALLPLALLVLAACPRAPALPTPSASPATPRGCGATPSAVCTRAQGLLGAAGAFSNVHHEYILDPTSSFAVGRGLEKSEAGEWGALPLACGKPHEVDGGKVDASTIDFAFVGVAIDSVLIAADADLTPYFSVGGSGSTKKLRLVAVAFVRDLDPQFFDATDDVAYGGGAACTCGRASHFVGAVKMGGMLSYEMNVREGEVHGRALDFVKAKVAAHDASITETRVGGLEVTGLEGVTSGLASPAIQFHVKNPVPLAYAVYPLADVCKFAFPAPEVAPIPVEFGDIAYGHEGTRMLHVLNRAPIALYASFRGHMFEVPARGTMDLETRWVPEGDAAGCESQVREDTISFTPRDDRAPVTPKQHSIRVVEHVRTGKPIFRQREHVDTGTARAPDYNATLRDFTCPPDYVVSDCRIEHAECGDQGAGCRSGGYAAMVSTTATGCHFGCQGPKSLVMSDNFCRFDAVMECRLRCAH